MTRYAEWDPTRADLIKLHLKRALWWPLRPVLRVWRRIEAVPVLVPLWERLNGPDYTGWTVRNPRDAGELKAGQTGTVTGYELRGRHRRYTCAFGRFDVLTALPAPEVELVGPPGRGEV